MNEGPFPSRHMRYLICLTLLNLSTKLKRQVRQEDKTDVQALTNSLILTEAVLPDDQAQPISKAKETGQKLLKDLLIKHPYIRQRTSIAPFIQACFI